MSIRIVFWALAILIVTPAVGFAQEDRYEEVRAKAKAAFDKGEYEEAALLFREAFDASPKGNLLYNIGLCYERSGNVQQAIIYYERFIQALPDSSKRPAVARKVSELKQNLDDKFQTVNVTSQPPGAVIFVDDKAKGAMGAAPIEFKLVPGDYTIIAELQGYEPVSVRHSVKGGGGVSKVAVRMVRASEIGEVTLFISERGANVMVDGSNVGKSPLAEPLRLASGSHEVSIMKPGFAPIKQTIQVEAGGKQRVKIDLSGEGGGLAGTGTPIDDGGGRSNIWPWVTMGTGVALVAGGVVTGLSAQSLHDKLDQKSKNNELIAPADIDTGNSTVLLTNVLLGAGSVAIVGGVLWWLLGDSGVDSEGSISGNIGVSPEGEPTVGVFGRF